MLWPKEGQDGTVAAEFPLCIGQYPGRGGAGLGHGPGVSLSRYFSLGILIMSPVRHVEPGRFAA